MKILSKFSFAAIAFKILSLSVLQFILVSQFAIAQNRPECFMLDANGNPIDLKHLCGSSPNNANTSIMRSRTSTNQNNADFFVVPIKRRVNGTPVVDVQFNDKYTFEMLFDTGATMTVITPAMAETLKLKPTGSLPFKTASNNLIYFQTGHVSSASAGDLVSDNMIIAVAPTLEIGLLGQNFYGMYDITIKYGLIEFRKR